VNLDGQSVPFFCAFHINGTVLWIKKGDLEDSRGLGILTDDFSLKRVVRFNDDGVSRFDIKHRICIGTDGVMVSLLHIFGKIMLCHSSLLYRWILTHDLELEFRPRSKYDTIKYIGAEYSPKNAQGATASVASRRARAHAVPLDATGVLPFFHNLLFFSAARAA